MAFTLAFILYSLFVVGVGVFSARYARESDEDFFLAGRSLGPWVAALSASASSSSGWVTLGLIGYAFTNGVIAYWIIPGCLLGFLFNWFVLAGPMRDRSHEIGALTLPDFFAFHFRERLPILRILSVIVILVAMWLYVAAQFAAAGKAFQAAFMGLDYRVGVIIGAVIVLVYTVAGGFRATCWTDFVQALVMVGALALFPVYLLVSYGGYDFITDTLSTESFALTQLWPQKTGVAFIGFLLGSGALGINLGYPGQPHVLVRFKALRRRRDAVLGGTISAVWAILIFWGAVTVGLCVRAMTINDAPWTAPLAAELAAGTAGAGETGLVLAAKHLIPGVLSGMVLAAVMSAIASTADSQLVVAASAGANDIYARLLERSRKTGHLLINRVVVLGLGIGAVLLVIDEDVEVFKFVLEYGWAVLGAAFGPQVILVLLWKRATYAGCVAGMLIGFIVALTWTAGWERFQARLADLVAAGDLSPDHWLVGLPLYNLTVAFFAAFLGNMVASLLTGNRKTFIRA